MVEGAVPANRFWAASESLDTGSAGGSMQSWDRVLEEVEALMQEGASVMSASRTVAKKYGVPRGRLQARVQSLPSGRETSGGAIADVPGAITDDDCPGDSPGTSKQFHVGGRDERK